MPWEESEDKLVRNFTFKDFKAAFAFLEKVAIEAETAQHHPEIYNVYNKVTLRLCTHDVGNKITEKDRRLALAIDRCYKAD